ncbi:MAG TPA: hypothetical protein VM389_06955, partial [Phycisphaerae bacterium]|nr:hypothetical protein [Phycisphaerae bacterium]
TRPDQRVEAGGVTILGPTNLPAAVPVHASEMFSRNVEAFLEELIKEGRVDLDPANEIIRGTLVTSAGEVGLREEAVDPQQQEESP